MRVMQVIGWVFLAVAAVMLTVAGVLYVQDRTFTESAGRATGVVTELVSKRGSDSNSGSTTSSRVHFTLADGREAEFVETISTSPPRHSVGDRVPVLYDRARPTSAMIDDFWSHRLGVVIVGAFAAIFGVLGAIFSGMGFAAGRRRARIVQNGTPVMADFVSAYPDRRFRINGSPAWRVVAEARDPMGRVRRFKSELVRHDPTHLLIGRKIKVTVDGSDGGYVVDLSGMVDERDLWRAR